MSKSTMDALWPSVAVFLIWDTFGIIANILWTAVLALTCAILMAFVTRQQCVCNGTESTEGEFVLASATAPAVRDAWRNTAVYPVRELVDVAWLPSRAE
jgi:hypothetical protein